MSFTQIIQSCHWEYNVEILANSFVDWIGRPVQNLQEICLVITYLPTVGLFLYTCSKSFCLILVIGLNCLTSWSHQFDFELICRDDSELNHWLGWSFNLSAMQKHLLAISVLWVVKKHTRVELKERPIIQYYIFIAFLSLFRWLVNNVWKHILFDFTGSCARVKHFLCTRIPFLNRANRVHHRPQWEQRTLIIRGLIAEYPQLVVTFCHLGINIIQIPALLALGWPNKLLVNLRQFEGDVRV